MSSSETPPTPPLRSGGETRPREGNLEAPTRHPVDWRNPAFYDEAALNHELERVFDICHGCRRCFSLCNAFPVLFDAVDASASGELDGVDKKVFWEVVDHCYLCDMCFMTKCPYVPPHPFDLDFPHLMLRAKAVKAKGGHPLADRILASTTGVGNLAGIPVVAEIVNAVNGTRAGRALLEKTLGVDRAAPLPEYHSRTGRARADAVAAKAAAPRSVAPAPAPVATPETTGRVAIFVTCYGNRNEPALPEDLAVILAHNGIEVRTVGREACCGMPKLELGLLEDVARYKEENIPRLLALIAEGYDILAPIPSCVLMFKQELPLLFPDDPDVAAVKARIFDPFEYLMLRHKGGLLRTDFPNRLGKVSYHVPCHLRVQNIGLKTRDVLKLVPDTVVEVIERCSGHDGTYGVKKRFRAASVKIGKPVATRVGNAGADHYSSDCPMAGRQIESILPEDAREPEHPLKLLRGAYGI